MNKLAWSMILSITCTLGLVADAGASTRICDGLISFEDIDEDVVAVGPCVLFGVSVNGDVKVEPGGGLVFIDTEIYGDVQSDGGGRIFGAGPPFAGAVGNLITGSLRLANLTGDGSGFNSGYAGSLDIEGDVQYEGNATGMIAVQGTVGDSIRAKDNAGSILAIAGNTVGEDVQVKENTSTRLLINGNRVDGDLDCKDNVPAPSLADPPQDVPNDVLGEKKGQCSGL